MVYLFRCVFLKTGQPWLDAVSLGPRLVCIVSFLDTAIVCNVLTLGVHSVQLKERYYIFGHQSYIRQP